MSDRFAPAATEDQACTSDRRTLCHMRGRRPCAAWDGQSWTTVIAERSAGRTVIQTASQSIGRSIGRTSSAPCGSELDSIYSEQRAHTRCASPGPGPRTGQVHRAQAPGAFANDSLRSRATRPPARVVRADRRRGHEAGGCAFDEPRSARIASQTWALASRRARSTSRPFRARWATSRRLAALTRWSAIRITIRGATQACTSIERRRSRAAGSGQHAHRARRWKAL